MITNIIILMATLGVSTLGISAFVKEKRRKQKQLRIAEAYERLVRQCKLTIDTQNFYATGTLALIGEIISLYLLIIALVKSKSNVFRYMKLLKAGLYT